MKTKLCIVQFIKPHSVTQIHRVHFLNKKNANFLTLPPTKKGPKDQSGAFQRPVVRGVPIESPDQMIAFNKKYLILWGTRECQKL